MWALALDHLKKQFQQQLNINVFVGIKRPPSTKDYPFIALTPVEFSETESKRIMKVSMPFGIKADKKDDTEEGTYKLLNLLTKIEQILQENKHFQYFNIEEEKYSIQDLSIQEPYYSMEFIFLISTPKMIPALED